MMLSSGQACAELVRAERKQHAAVLKRISTACSALSVNAISDVPPAPQGLFFQLDQHRRLTKVLNFPNPK